jgi:NAD/NADP transhydrogenase alpha subunit
MNDKQLEDQLRDAATELMARGWTVIIRPATVDGKPAPHIVVEKTIKP